MHALMPQNNGSKFQFRGLLFVLIILGLMIDRGIAQTTDLARVEYAYIPQAKSNNSINRFRAFVNYPITLGWEGSFLVAGLEYRNIDLDYEDIAPFDTEKLERFQLFRTTLAYTFKMKGYWRFAAKVGIEINSNFDESTFSSEDVNFTSAVFFIKDRSGKGVVRPYRYILGLNYSTNAGRPFPLPVINFYQKFKPNWSYSLGTPKTNLKYFLGEKNTFQAFVTLDGFFSNIQNNLNVMRPGGNVVVADTISMTMVLGGVGYEYYITKHLLFYVYGGHSFYNEIRLRDNKRTKLYTINNANTYYARGGIKFKL